MTMKTYSLFQKPLSLHKTLLVEGFFPVTSKSLKRWTRRSNITDDLPSLLHLPSTLPPHFGTIPPPRAAQYVQRLYVKLSFKNPHPPHFHPQSTQLWLITVFSPVPIDDHSIYEPISLNKLSGLTRSSAFYPPIYFPQNSHLPHLKSPVTALTGQPGYFGDGITILTLTHISIFSWFAPQYTSHLQ